MGSPLSGALSCSFLGSLGIYKQVWDIYGLAWPEVEIRGPLFSAKHRIIMLG